MRHGRGAYAEELSEAEVETELWENENPGRSRGFSFLKEKPDYMAATKSGTMEAL
jgi:hypothetical protein